MSLIVIFGAQASGKMTVGQEIREMTKYSYKYNLFYNHMAIDMVGEIFDYWNVGGVWNLGNESGKLISDIWDMVIKFSLRNNENLVFTLTLDMDNSSMIHYLSRLEKEFEEVGERVYFVELNCDEKERLRRNKTENRLQKKICKRNIEQSEYEIEQDSRQVRMVSRDGELRFKRYIRIQNTAMTAHEVAEKVINMVKANGEKLKEVCIYESD